MKPWQVKASVIRFSGVELARVFLIPEKRHVDVDPSGLLTSHPKAYLVAKDIIRKMGYQFPLPMRAATYVDILNGDDFPEFSKWEARHGEHYPESAYKQDVKLMVLSRLQLNTVDKLKDFTARMALQLPERIGSQGSLTLDNAISYSRSALNLIIQSATQLSILPGEIPGFSKLFEWHERNKLVLATQSEYSPKGKNKGDTHGTNAAPNKSDTVSTSRRSQSSWL